MPPSGNRYNVVPSDTSRVYCRSDVIAPTALGAPLSEQPQAIEGNGYGGSHVGERVEIGEAGAGDTMPEVSMARIDPLWALNHLPEELLAGGVNADLEEHAMDLWVAKGGMVRICRSYSLAFEPVNELPQEYTRLARSVTKDGDFACRRRLRGLSPLQVLDYKGGARV